MNRQVSSCFIWVGFEGKTGLKRKVCEVPRKRIFLELLTTNLIILSGRLIEEWVEIGRADFQEMACSRIS